MKNIIYYIKRNIKDKDYVVSIEPYYNNNELTYKELKIEEILKFTNCLRKKIGINNYKKRIGILMSNCNWFVETFYSIILCGYTVLAINDKIELDELNDIIEKNNLEYIITNQEFAKLLGKSIVQNIINIETAEYQNYSSDYIFDIENPKMNDNFVISFTSGTSGNYSKGVILTYKNISFVSEKYTELYGLSNESKIITVLPLWHNYAMFACLTSSIASKSTLVMMKKWNSKLFIDINVNINPTVFPGSPYMYIDLINSYSDTVPNLSNLKVCDSGGDSLPIECIKKFENLTGAVITEGYGLTETSSLTHFNNSASERKVGSLGKCVSNTECKICDLNGNILDDDNWGLLWIKGPMVFKEYVGFKAEKLGVKSKDGWFNTNDIVRKDSQGFYYIAGRFSDLKSINNDENELRELENKLYAFSGISRVHIKTNFNQIAKFYFFDLVVVLKKNTATENLYDYVNANLKNYVIRNIKIVDELPTTGTGKIKRNKIQCLLENNKNDYMDYAKKEIFGGLRCNTYLLNKGQNKVIYQEYKENTMYQALKKWNITNFIKENSDNNFIANVINYGIEKEYSWLLSEYKCGETLEELRKSGFDLKNITEDIAKCIYNIHSIKVDNKYGWITDTEVFEHNSFSEYMKSELDRFNNAVSGKIKKEFVDELNKKANDALFIIEKYDDSYKPVLCWFDLNPNNILIKCKKLSAIVDAGGCKYGIKELDLAFLRMEVCYNEEEYQSLLNSYKKYSNVNEEVINALCVFIELDDMIIRILDNEYIKAPYCSAFLNIINNL